MAAGHMSNIDIIINILVQGFNVFLFFLIFKYFFADAIVEAVEKRRQLLSKLKNAEQEYEKILSEAEQKKQQIIQETLQHKEKLIEEAKALAYQEKEKILSQAQKQADEIIENAKAFGEKLKKQLESEWENALKQTSKLVVMKLFEGDVELKEKYLEEVVKQFKKLINI